MRKLLKIVFGVVLGSLVLMFGCAMIVGMFAPDDVKQAARESAARAGSTPSPAPTSTPTPAPAQASTPKWTTVKTWSGNGMKDTETFEVTSREWRINWETKNEPFANAGILQIFVQNDRDQMVNLAANKQGPGKDVSYVRGAGKYYLKISSANIDWSVTVEDQR